MGEMALVEALALVMALVGAGEMMATEALALVAETWGRSRRSQCLPTLPTSPLR